MELAVKMNPVAIKLFFVILYGEHEYPWIRRHGYRFALDVRSTCKLFRLTKLRSAEDLFVSLQNLGWIYHYRKDLVCFRFTVRPPHWLSLSDTSPLTERYVQWERAYDGAVDPHPDPKYIRTLAESYPERKATFDRLQQISVESEGPLPVEEILGE